MTKKHGPMNKPRTPVPDQQYKDNWDEIFGKKEKGVKDAVCRREQKQ